MTMRTEQHPLFFSAMISCHRKRPYWLKAIDSYLSDVSAPQLHVFVDGDSAAYLGKQVCESQRVSIRAEPCEKRTPTGRCAVNAARAFSKGAQFGKPMLFLEDDSWLAKNWVSRLHESVVEAQAKREPRFMLALFSSGVPRAPAHRRTAPYHPSQYYGLVGCYFSASAVALLHQAFAEEVQKSRPLASDMLVKQRIWEDKILLLKTNPSLVNHLGDLSHINDHVRVIRAPGWRG